MTLELEHRVGQVELEQARQGEQLQQVRAEVRQTRDEVAKVNSGVEKLLERQASAPSALTGKTIAATCGGLVGVAYVVWWLIGASPAVVDLGRRLDRLDDREVGRVPAIERRLDKVDGWTATVRR